MKNLNEIFEGLLDVDFDGPNIDVDQIVATRPVLDDGSWEDYIKKVNEISFPYQFVAKINELVRLADEVTTDLKDWRDIYHRSNLSSVIEWIRSGAKYKPVDVSKYDDSDVRKSRILNEWLIKFNAISGMKKLFEALGGHFTYFVSDRHRNGETIYAAFTWCLESPNENAQEQVQKIVDKANKINKNIACSFGMNSDGCGIFKARLIKI